MLLKNLPQAVKSEEQIDPLLLMKSVLQISLGQKKYIKFQLVYTKNVVASKLIRKADAKEKKRNLEATKRSAQH